MPAPSPGAGFSELVLVEAGVGGDVRFARVLFVVLVEIGGGRHPVLVGRARAGEAPGEGDLDGVGPGPGDGGRADLLLGGRLDLRVDLPVLVLEADEGVD